jgi:glycerol kinase
VILAIDQGTTGTTCLVVDESLRVAGRGYRELAQSYPRPGWVEHDAEEIWQTVQEAAAVALADAGVPAAALRAIGITNQRETTVLWDRRSGRPLAPAIVWQDRRTAEHCRRLPADLIRERTGLLPDPYFSATKLVWLLEQTGHPAGAAFGTIDSWLAWRLTGGEHVTDHSNAARTMLYGLAAADWDDELLALFGIEEAILPRIVPSSGVVGDARIVGARVPLAALAGDQQSALFGQGCLAPGQAKATYGTGSFILVNAGRALPEPPPGLLVTAAAQPGVFALEGAVFMAGATLQWLRDGLGILAGAAESEELARSVASTGGVYLVPAMAGLGSPYWDPDARGLISGITRGTGRAELVRAALEAVAFQVVDVVDAGGIRPGILRADGGAAANAWLMQFQADLLGVPVEVAAEPEMTAFGAAGLAGLAVGVWADADELAAVWRRSARYEPSLPEGRAAELLGGWREAVGRARSAPEPGAQRTWKRI